MRDKGKSDHFSLQNLVKTERHVCCICGLQVSFNKKKRCAFSRGLDMKGRREIPVDDFTEKKIKCNFLCILTPDSPSYFFFRNFQQDKPIEGADNAREMLTGSKCLYLLLICFWNLLPLSLLSFL